MYVDELNDDDDDDDDNVRVHTSVTNWTTV